MTNRKVHFRIEQDHVEQHKAKTSRTRLHRNTVSRTKQDRIAHDRIRHNSAEQENSCTIEQPENETIAGPNNLYLNRTD